MVNNAALLIERGYIPAGTYSRTDHKIISKGSIAGVECRIITGENLKRGVLPRTQIKLIGGFPVSVENKTFYIKA